MTNLSGKAIIVTGASRGIGAATSMELSLAGAAVILAARNENEIKHNAKEIRNRATKMSRV